MATVIAELNPAPDRSVGDRFATLADDARVVRTAAALETHGINVLRAADAAEARRIVLGLIGPGGRDAALLNP